MISARRALCCRQCMPDLAPTRGTLCSAFSVPMCAGRPVPCAKHSDNHVRHPPLAQATKAKVSAELEGMQCEVQQLMDRIRETRQSVGDADARDARLRTMWHEKTFRPRDSLLTEMLEGSEHFRTIYNIAVAVLLILFLQIIVTDWVEHGRFVDLSLFAWAFSGIGIVVPAWVAMSLTSLLVVPWVQLVHRHNWSWRVWLAPYVLVQLLLYTYSGYVCLSNGMAVPSALIVAVEQTRISLKMHAYLREKLLHGRAHETVTKALQWLRSQPKGTPPAESPAEATRQAQGEDDGGLSQFPFEVDPTSPAGYALWIPAWARRRGVTLLHVEPPAITIGDASTEIGRFLYFFFAPTLIYRDAYPRTSAKVDWLQAGVHMAEFLGVISYCYVILTTFISPYFAETPSNPGDLRSFVRSVFHSMAPGMMVLVLMVRCQRPHLGTQPPSRAHTALPCTVLRRAARAVQSLRSLPAPCRSQVLR